MYKIIVDSAANLPSTIAEKYDIEVLSMNVYVDENEIPGYEPHLSLEQEREKGRRYYDAIRNGAKVKTSLVNAGRFEEAFSQYVKQGKDVLYFSLSKNISGTYQAARIAADIVNEENEHQVYCIDSLNASLGQGLLAIYAAIMQDKGMDVIKVYEVLNDTVNYMNGMFTVDDLQYLAATGRLHGGVAAIGQVLKIKPLLKGNSEGYIVSFKKCHGRKKALQALIDLVAENAIHPEKQILGVAQADCYNESLEVIHKIQERCQFKEVIHTSYDFCTGSHVGPGTVALFFIASDRELAGKNKEDIKLFDCI